MTTSRSSRIGMYLAIGIALALAAIQGGKLIGEPLAKDTVERLELIWPDFMQKPESERTVVIRAAYKCRLAMQPLQKEAVRQCLRQGANDLKDASAEGEVERLLNHAGG